MRLKPADAVIGAVHMTRASAASRMNLRFRCMIQGMVIGQSSRDAKCGGSLHQVKPGCQSSFADRNGEGRFACLENSESALRSKTDLRRDSLGCIFLLESNGNARAESASDRASQVVENECRL